MGKELNLVELFSGIGGFSKGLIDAGLTFKNHYFSEIDKHATANYKYNFQNAKHIGAIQDVRGRELERPDILTFGFPCQDVSIAGKRKGFSGKRSSLFYEAMRLVDEAKPSVFIFENVKGLFSSNKGNDFTAVLRTITDIGLYDCEWQLLNTSWFLPQNRERIFFIGHLRGKSKPQVFPFRESDFRADERKQEHEATSVRTITAGGHSGGQHSGMTVIRTLMTGTNGGQHQNMTLIAEPIITNRGHGYFKGSENKICPTLNAKSSMDNLSITQQNMSGQLFKNNHAGTLRSGASANYMTVNNMRRLTEIECERLQGFPDDWTKFGNYDGVIKEIAKTQRYKLCGNAVTTKVVKAIGERLTF